jgi:hypothetical protein
VTTESAGMAAAAIPSQRRPRRLFRRRLAGVLGAAAVALLAGAGVAFLQVQTDTSTNVVAASSLPGGVAVDVTSVSNAITLSRGRAQTVAGVEIYRIAMGDPTLATHLLVNFVWVDPQDANAVLSNPNSWIEIGVYYNSGTAPSNGACPSGQYLIDDPTDGQVCAVADGGSRALAPLTPSNADAVLVATPGRHTVAYLLASINTPGNAPPGQQGQLTTLQYNVDVQMH